MALVRKQKSREGNQQGEDVANIPGISSYIENWLLEQHSSPKHRMSASPPVQQITSADVTRDKELQDTIYIRKDCQIVSRMSVPTPRIPSKKYRSSYFKWIDVISNYNENKYATDGWYQELPTCPNVERGDWGVLYHDT